MRDQDDYCNKLIENLDSARSKIDVLSKEVVKLEVRNRQSKLKAAISDMHNARLEQQIEYYKERNLELMAKNTQLKSAIDELNRIRGN
jgi:hypothetical protein